MNRSGVVSVALVLAALCISGRAQSGCKPNDPTGYFEGNATSLQAGKLDVSLNLRCDDGQYSGELATPVGTYTLKEAHFDTGHLHLNLQSGADSVTLEIALEDAILRGSFATADDGGPVELHRTGQAKPTAASGGGGLSLSKDQWHDDLMFLARELPRRHANAFHSISRERFEAEVADLDGQLDHYERRRNLRRYGPHCQFNRRRSHLPAGPRRQCQLPHRLRTFRG